MKKQRKSYINYFVMFCALILATFSTAQAAAFVVNSTGDLKDQLPGDGICATSDQVCTLRAAIEETNELPGDDTIGFSASFYAPNAPRTIVLSLGELFIKEDASGNSALTIKGPGARQLIVDGNHKSRVFFVYNAAFTMSGVTVQNGYFTESKFSADGGAGLCNFFATVNLTGVTIRDNSTASDQNPLEGTAGGGIYNYQGVITIKDSTISGNKSPRGGGIETSSQSTLNVFNSTITNNVSTYVSGGGIGSWGYLNVRNSTITNNSGMNPPNTAPAYQNAGGIYHYDFSPYVINTAYIANTIIANNTAPANKDIAGKIISLGNNLVRSRGTSTGYVASDLPDGTDPKLGALKNNGGQTDTRNLLSFSPAIDAGNNCMLPGSACVGDSDYDQRGLGYKRKWGSSIDIGAFEFQPVRMNPTPVLISGKLFQPDGRGASPAIVSLIDRNGATVASVVTDEEGRYSFEGVETGRAYVIRVENSERSYEPQTLVVTEARDDVNFVPAEDQNPSENPREKR